ncbi:MAG: site-specific integrase [Nanoarchaeota archaeon]|nr:site-specific integrase [Nanoarchaeota archaeon]MBU1632434.1 site-specific integrase [Nanoarchaeota archaeon]MBU1875607.1 site-specific integrase [Nanoarchaeota archaeon]
MKKKVIRYLSNDEFNSLKNKINDNRDKLILNILYETGCTVNELVKIKTKDIDFGKKIIKFPPESTKSNKLRTSFISKELAKEIEKFTEKNSSQHIFTTRQGSGITTKRIRQLIQNYSQKAGFGKINPQVIRYTHIAHALEKGIPLTAIQKQVGMERLRIVQIYEALVPEEKEGNYDKFFEKGDS